MKAAYPLLLGACLLSTVACDNEPARSKSQPRAATPDTRAGTAPSAYSFSDATSSIEFVGAKLTRKHDGRFGTFRGSIQMVDQDPSKSSVSLVIDTASLATDDAKLTRHLQSPDFFDVERFPKATFRSTSIAAAERDGATHTITGNLELHGVTKQLVFPARIKALSATVEATAEFAINRKDFGIAYSGVAGDLIREQVLLMIRLNARRD